MIAEKIDVGIPGFTRLGAAFLIGFFVSCWWYQTGSFEKIEKAVPVLQASEGCEHNRANKAIALALQPTIVDPKSLPKDNCQHPKVDVPPAEHPLTK